MLAKELMKRTVATIGPDTSLALAARTMRNQDVGCLPVIEGDRLIGIITDRYRAARRGRGAGPNCSIVRDVMSTIAFACSPEDTVDQAEA